MSDVTTEREARLDRTDLQRIFDRYHQAWEAKDPDAIVALHTEDSTFVLRGGEERVQGRTALRAHFAAVFDRFAGYRAEVQRLLLGDGHWVLEWTMVVDLQGIEGLPFTARIDLLDVVDVNADGQVVRKDVYVDGAQQMAAYRRAGWA
ncbi:nuclear transport factor 2 family protein [Kribbella sp. NPDC003505]|uniref:nuclear transport factor 2 family protein n=1 Tax=Kribbella sp. NPDC003505 TaxID=3154448 RepID=UPI0033B80C75